MALTKEQKDVLRARVAEAVNDPTAAARATSLRHIRVSDPTTGYSVRNTLMLLMQWAERQAAHGGATPLTLCAGFVEWRQHGRAVRKGEPGLFILAGGAGASGDAGPADAEPASDGSGDGKRRFFGGAYVWDISQTDPLPGDPAIDRVDQAAPASPTAATPANRGAAA